jgi:Rrf2 family protein
LTGKVEMRISKRGEYALRALIDIGIATELGKPLVQIGELASQEKLPVKFLEQILMQLKGGGFVSSQRGKHGGYRLHKPMDTIKFGDVVRLIDGPLAPIACVSQTAYERCTCPDEVHCGLRMLMLDVRNAIADILDKYSLADIVDITLRKMKRDRVPLPFLMELVGLQTGAARPLPLKTASPSKQSRTPSRAATQKPVRTTI